MLKRVLSASLFCVGVAVAARAQCSIKSYTSPTNGLVSQAKIETLLKSVGDDNNGDYSRGFEVVMGGLITTVRPNSSSKNWMLQVIIGSSPGREQVVPRAVIFKFTNGTMLRLLADTYEEKNGARSCLFKLSPAERLELSKPLQAFIVQDTRMDDGDGGYTSYVCTAQLGLYSMVFAEQAACLDRIK